MKKNLNMIGILVVLGIFLIFYLIATISLNKRNLSKNITKEEEPVKEEENNYDKEKTIVNNLYQNIKILYDVVNNKFKVDTEDTIIIGDITYKRITNFDEVMNNTFTSEGTKKYIDDLGNYFAHNDENIYIAGNLVSYQTYYFRGDETNIYITGATDKEIDAIIYERWTSNNKNTLATVKVVMEENKWLVDRVDILATE